MLKLGMCALFLLPSALIAGNWTAFRGTGNNISTEQQLPETWSASKNITWTADLPGYGQSSPVVWGKQVFVTAVAGEMREKGFVVGLDAATGKQQWMHEFTPTIQVKSGFSVSRAAPTPCVDANGVYCFFEGGNLLAFTHAGKLLWERSIAKEYGEFQGGHGIGASPCQSDDRLFILIDHNGPCYLLAVDKKTGKTLWKTDRDVKMSWSSPVYTKNGTQEMVVCSSNGSVCAYDAQSGKEIWKMTGVAGNTIPSATVVDGAIVVGGSNPRGKEPAADAKSNFCLEMDGKQTVRWSAKAGLASYASPLVYEGLVYYVNAVGNLTCIDLKTGKELYSERIDGPCWATPVAAEGKIFCFGKNGTTTVLKAGKEFDLLATNKLWADAKSADAPEQKGGFGSYGDPILYGVAVADHSFFVRSGTQLIRISK
ncbi:MAG: PQQ-binding-like beta-propeller repeat protein [Zavarzinella sp.]